MGPVGTRPPSGYAGRTQVPSRRLGNSNCRQWVFLIVVIHRGNDYGGIHDFDGLISAPTRAHQVTGRATRTPPEPKPKNRPPRGDAGAQHRQRKVERSVASNTLRRGRAEALAPQDRQPAQVL